MKCISIKENKNGSATMILEITEKENAILVGYAVNDLMKKYIEEHKIMNSKKKVKKSTTYVVTK